MGDQLETGAAIALGAIIIAFLVARVLARANPFKLTDQALGDDAYGDWPALPDDLKISVHSQER